MVTNLPEKSKDIAFQRQMFELAYGDRVEEIEKNFGFSLDDLPEIDRGVITKHPLDFAQEMASFSSCSLRTHSSPIVKSSILRGDHSGSKCHLL